ncbi:MAG TPA: ABC transporter permease [Acidimicrobiales bacterium]|nr:ABC transporter permease [Acidimicrobiales bacterium]
MTATLALVGTRRALRVVERNGRSYVRQWPVFVSAFIEPILYLLSIGVGVGELVGQVSGPGGRPVDYDQFVAPAMMAVAAMNGCVFDTTIGFFFKTKYAKTYDGMLATPLGVDDVVRGELAWALGRSILHALVFLATMAVLGLVPSGWGLLAVPAAGLVGFAFGGAGLGLTTYMRSWFDFDYIQIAIVPLFLFSATFFPIDEYPTVVGWIVRCSPLYQGVAIERALVLGEPSPVLLVHAAYLLALGWYGVRVASRRLARMLQP